MKRTKEEYELAISESFSIAETCRKLGIRPTGGNYRIVHNAIEKYNLDTSHFTGQGWNIGLKFNPSPAQPIKDILVENSSYQVFKLKNRPPEYSEGRFYIHILSEFSAFSDKIDYILKDFIVFTDSFN